MHAHAHTRAHAPRRTPRLGCRRIARGTRPPACGCAAGAQRTATARRRRRCVWGGGGTAVCVCVGVCACVEVWWGWQCSAAATLSRRSAARALRHTRSRAHGTHPKHSTSRSSGGMCLRACAPDRQAPARGGGAACQSTCPPQLQAMQRTCTAPARRQCTVAATTRAHAHLLRPDQLQLVQAAALEDPGRLAVAHGGCGAGDPLHTLAAGIADEGRRAPAKCVCSDRAIAARACTGWVCWQSRNALHACKALELVISGANSLLTVKHAQQMRPCRGLASCSGAVRQLMFVLGGLPPAARLPQAHPMRQRVRRRAPCVRVHGGVWCS
jgi:hypothetical protein